MTSGQVILYALLAGGGLWVLHKIGQFLTKLLEAAAAIAVVFLTLWLLVKAVWKTGRWLVRHWRTTLTTVAVLAWLRWWGWPSLAITIAVVAAGVGGVAVGSPRHVRALRRAVAARLVVALGRLRPPHARLAARLPPDASPTPGQPVTVQVTPFRRTAVAPKVKPRRDQVPRVIGVRSGPSWDEVRVRLVPGQKPGGLRPGRPGAGRRPGVARCQVRELAPNVVSIDFQRRDLLADPVACRRPRRPGRCARGGHRFAAGVVRAHRVRPATGTSPAGRRPHPGGRRDRGGQELGDAGAPSCPSPPPSATAWCGCRGSTRRAWNWPTGGGSSTATPSPARRPGAAR